MGLMDILFGKQLASEDKIKKLLEEDVVVIDVRTPQEFKSGHVKRSKNIPLQELSSRTDEIKAFEKPVIFCCATGNRSGTAAKRMQAEGVECVNGGGWERVSRIVNS